MARTIRVGQTDDLIRIVIEQNGAEYHPVPVRRLYDLKAAAIYLGRKVSGVRELIHSGELPYLKAGRGGKQFIDIGDMDDYVEREKTREINFSSKKRV